MTKLTLSIDKMTARKAKEVAKANGTSVSSMFRHFVQSVAADREPPNPIMKVGPLTRKLSGIVKLPPGKDYKELRTASLMDQYGISE